MPYIKDDFRFEELDGNIASVHRFICSPMLFEDKVVGVILLADQGH